MALARVVVPSVDLRAGGRDDRRHHSRPTQVGKARVPCDPFWFGPSLVGRERYGLRERRNAQPRRQRADEQSWYRGESNRLGQAFESDHSHAVIPLLPHEFFLTRDVRVKPRCFLNVEPQSPAPNCRVRQQNRVIIIPNSFLSVGFLVNAPCQFCRRASRFPRPFAKPFAREKRMLQVPY